VASVPGKTSPQESALPRPQQQHENLVLLLLDRRREIKEEEIVLNAPRKKQPWSKGDEYRSGNL
jgi:hypothetical protein